MTLIFDINGLNKYLHPIIDKIASFTALPAFDGKRALITRLVLGSGPADARASTLAIHKIRANMIGSVLPSFTVENPARIFVGS